MPPSLTQWNNSEIGKEGTMKSEHLLLVEHGLPTTYDLQQVRNGDSYGVQHESFSCEREPDRTLVESQRRKGGSYRVDDLYGSEY